MKKIPCWLCKGSGIIEEGERIDVGLGPFITQQVSADLECGFCEGEGMIEIGGPKHLEYKRDIMRVSY